MVVTLALLVLLPTPFAVVAPPSQPLSRIPVQANVRGIPKRADAVPANGLEHGRPGERLVHGFVVSANPQTILLRTRKGLLRVDVSHAYSFVDPTPQRPLIVVGRLADDGVLYARRVHRTFPDSTRWSPDQ